MAAFTAGHPKVGGRKRGTPNKVTVDRDERLARAMAAAVEATGIAAPTLGDMSPLSVMLFVMVQRARAGDHAGALAAAGMAAPYCHARLSQQDITVRRELSTLSDADLLAEARQIEAHMAATGLMIEAVPEPPTEPLQPVEASEPGGAEATEPEEASGTLAEALERVSEEAG